MLSWEGLRVSFEAMVSFRVRPYKTNCSTLQTARLSSILNKVISNRIGDTVYGYGCV